VRPRGRDVRLLGAAITVGIVALGGAGLALIPEAPESAAARGEGPAHAAQVDLAFRQGVVMLHAKQYEHALTAFHRVLKFAPEMPEAHANMGYALVGLGRHREARGFFEGAIALRPGQVNAYYGLALAAEGLGDLEVARGAMRTYVHLAPAGDPHRRKAESALWEWSGKADGTALATPAKSPRRTGP
jgi:tetratricopeptide (TPR) repeat protein